MGCGRLIAYLEKPENSQVLVELCDAAGIQECNARQLLQIIPKNSTLDSDLFVNGAVMPDVAKLRSLIQSALAELQNLTPPCSPALSSI